MLRTVWFLILLSLAVGIAVWFADHPGEVTAVWLGREITTSVSLLVSVVVLITVIAAFSYRIWLFLRRSPGQIKEAWKGRKRRQGYEALSKGMVAVAAGDAGEAKRLARRAEALLSDPPLTLLLSAQAAQLAGDEKAAEGFFSAMADNPEMAFLGLRGLITQALKAGDKETALPLARQAFQLQPKSQWVAETLFQLQTASQLWLEAKSTNEAFVRAKHMDPVAARRRRAVLVFQQAEIAREAGDVTEELNQLKAANDLAPDFVPAAVRLGARHGMDGRTRKAQGVLEKAWARSPHPDLVDPYLRAGRPLEGLKRLRAVEKLVSGAKMRAESRVAVAEAAIGAELWGEARAQLEPLLKDGSMDLEVAGAFGRAARLMAKAEEAETNDLAKAQTWLLRAAVADPDPAWVCKTCSTVRSNWVAVCPVCSSFDSYEWKTPVHLERPLDETTLPVALDSGAAEAPVVVPGNGSFTLKTGAGAEVDVTPAPPDVAAPRPKSTEDAAEAIDETSKALHGDDVPPPDIAAPKAAPDDDQGRARPWYDR